MSVFTRKGKKRPVAERSIIDDLAGLDAEETRLQPSFTPAPSPRTPDVLPERTPFFDAMTRPVLACSHCKSVHADPDAGAYARVYDRLRNTAVKAGWRPDACGCHWSCPECVDNGTWTLRNAPRPVNARSEWWLIEHVHTVALNPNLALALAQEWPWDGGRHARTLLGVNR